jgi:hypothetical protein
MRDDYDVPMKKCDPATVEAQFAAIEKMQKELSRLIACVAESIRIAGLPAKKRRTRRR